jgi:hypothetical protein
MGRVPLRHPPRHLAVARRSRTGAREPLAVEWLLAAVAILLTTAVVLSSLFDLPGGEEPPPAAAPPTAAPPTSGAPPSTGGGNLVADPGFEAGLAGWRPIGGAPIGRTAPARGGGWAAGFTATGAADQGMALAGVVRCTPGRRYAAAIWVRASRPETLLQVNLLEVVAGRRFAVDTVGAVLRDRRWQRVEVVHDAHRSDAALALELVLPRGSPRSTVLVDDLEVVAHKASFMSHE